MVIEIVRSTIKPGQAEEFQKAFADASRHLQAAKGYLGHDLRQGIENPDQFVLTVQWNTYEDHVNGFRGSPPWEEFRNALGAYYAAPSEVTHWREP